VLTVLLALGLTGCPPPAPPAPPNPAGDTPLTQRLSDGWRYDLDHQSEFPYSQMIYFNFRDDNHDIVAVIGHGVFYSENPAFAASANFYSSTAMLMPDPAVRDSMRVWHFEYDAITPGGAPPHSPTFSEGPGVPEFACRSGTIDVLDPATPDGSNLADTYHLVGGISENGQTITWDLIYERVELPGWFLWEKWPQPAALGFIRDTWLSYAVHMPVARVNGTFVVNDGHEMVVYDIVDAKGYHDGFHGEFVPTLVEWDWIEFKQWTQEPLPPGAEPELDIWVYFLNQGGPYFACEGGWDPCMPGNLRAVANGTTYDFFRQEIDIQRLAWAVDPEFGGTYPTEAIVTGENADHFLCVQWQMLPGRMEKSYWDVPAPLRDNVTYEYVSNVEGSLIAKDPAGDCSACSADCTLPCPACGTAIKGFGGIGYTDYVGPPFL